MTPADFHAAYRPTADTVSAGTNIDAIVLLAQWANETAWGTHFAGANNLGNIQSGGKSINYASLAAFAQACIATFNSGPYGAVIAAANTDDAMAALIASPWAAGHYGGNLHPWFDPLEGFELNKDQDFKLALLANDMIGGAEDNQNGVAATVHRIEKAVKALASTGVQVDLTPVLNAIADLKAHPAVVADPSVLAIVTRIENAMKAQGAALQGA